MYSREVQNQEWSLEELQHSLGIAMKTSHPEGPNTIYY